MKKALFIFLSFITFAYINAQDVATISGQVTDYNGNPIDSCSVRLYYTDFSSAYETITDKNGNYVLNNVEKGKYMGMYVLRPKEYPRTDAVPDEDKRLEFWAWNIIVDRDLTINPHYHRLELYGTNVFKIEGSYPGLMVYTRPMSAGKHISYSKEILRDKRKAEQSADISVLPENFDVKVFADDEELKVNLIQPVTEYVGEGNLPMRAFLISVDSPRKRPTKPYRIFRVVGYNKEYNEWGENLYFYEIKDYKRNTKIQK